MRTFRPDLLSLECRLAPALVGQQLFPDDNPWNQRIADAPVAANSRAILDAIIANQGGDGGLHPDFGQRYGDDSDLYGIPVNVASASTPRVEVVLDAYPDESDLGAVPIPANAVLEGDLANGPRVGVDERGDSHLIVFDADNNVAYELFRASRPSENADGRWHADQQSVWDMNTNTFRTLGFTSADAAGLPILAGLVRPDEALPVDQGGQGVIDHAIRFTLRNALILDQYQYPASHVANGGNEDRATMPAMGARFRLRADVDISGLNPQSRVVAQAMKDYGLIVADNGSNFFFSGSSYSVDAANNQTLTWDDEDIQDSETGLKGLNFSDFEVVDLTPVVTGLSAAGGPVGTEVTVVGRNFSGAAGRLEVFFGDTPATSVTVLDDGRVVAIAPAGSGTVPVTVRSGAVTGDDEDNYTAPVFGYGTSAVTDAAAFTYGSDPLPPTTPIPPTTPPVTPPTTPPVTPPVTPPTVPPITVEGDPFAVAGSGTVTVHTADGAVAYTLAPFGDDFTQGVRVALADVNGDGIDDLICGAGPGAAPTLKVFDGATRGELLSVDVFESRFTGGLYVAAGDLNGDGLADIVATPDRGGGPRVRAFDGATFGQLFDFFGIDDRAFRGGARAAVGDLNADGRADLLVAAGFGGGPRVAGYDGRSLTNKLFADFFVFEPGLRNGAFVALGDIDGDGYSDVIAGGGPGGAPRVFALSGRELVAGNRASLANFFAGDANSRGGVRVAAKNINDDGFVDLIVGTESAVVRYDGRSLGAEIPTELGRDPAFGGGVFVG